MAAFLVITFHVAIRLNRFDPPDGVARILIESITSPCNTLFLFISGLFLLDPSRQESLPDFLRKRFLRLIIPLLFWSALQLWIRHLAGHPFSWADAARRLLQGNVHASFWFIYMLAGVYLATPILRTFTRSASRSEIAYFVVLWLFAEVVRPVLNLRLGLSIGIDIFMATGLVGLFVLGHAIERLVPRRLPTATLAAAAAVGLVIMIVPSILSIQPGRDGGYAKGAYYMTAPGGLTFSVAVYLLIRQAPWDRVAIRLPAVVPLVRALAASSFTLYLAHVVVMDAVDPFIIQFLHSRSVIEALGKVAVLSVFFYAGIAAADRSVRWAAAAVLRLRNAKLPQNL